MVFKAEIAEKTKERDEIGFLCFLMFSYVFLCFLMHFYAFLCISMLFYAEMS